MLTEEELEQLIKERPESKDLILQLVKIGVDPLAGMGFVKDYMEQINATKFKLEQQYGLYVEVVCQVSIRGNRNSHEEHRFVGFSG